MGKIIEKNETKIKTDDTSTNSNDNNSKEYSSQGLQKLIVLAMKLSEVKIFIDEYDIVPILLLDDLFSELDTTKINNSFCLDNCSGFTFEGENHKSVRIEIIKLHFYSYIFDFFCIFV